MKNTIKSYYENRAKNTWEKDKEKDHDFDYGFREINRMVNFPPKTLLFLLLSINFIIFLLICYLSFLVDNLLLRRIFQALAFIWIAHKMTATYHSIKYKFKDDFK